VGWGDVAARQAGVISRAQLRIGGLTDHMVDGLLASGGLTPLARGVFLVRGAPVTYEVGLWSAVLSTGGVLGFASAAHLWGLIDEAPDGVHVIIRRDLHLQRPHGVRTYRHDLWPQLIDQRHGLPITSRTTTVLDYIGRLRIGEAGRVADRAAQRGWLRAADIDRRLHQQPGRTGNPRLRELLPMLSDGAAAKSERVLHALLRKAGIDGWVPNYDVWHDGVLAGVVDIAFPRLRIAIEVDGWAFHHSHDRFQRDRTRQNHLVTLGWTVLRFTWADLVDRPGYVIAAIRQIVVDWPALSG